MFYSISVPLMLLMGAASPDSSDLSSYPLIVPGVVFLLLVFWVVRDIETLGRNRGNASGSASDALIASPPDNSMKAFIERHFGYLFMIPGGEDGIGPLWDILNNYDDKKNKGIPDWVGLHQSLMVLGVNESTAKEIMKEMQSNQWTLPDNPLAHIHRAAKGQKGLATGKSTIASFAEALPWAPEWLVNFLASTIGILHINELGMFANPFNSALIRDEHLDHASLAVAAFWVMRAATVAGAVLMAHNAHGASGSIVAFLVGAAGSYLATHLLINLVFMAYQAVGLANQAVNKTYSDEDRVNLAFSGLFGATFMALFSGAHQLSLESAGLSVTLGLLVTMGTWIILRQRARAQAEAVAAAMIPVMQAMNSATLLGERLKNPRGLIGVFLSKLSGEDPNLSKRIEEEAPKLANEGA
jgi:hypothetical protein